MEKKKMLRSLVSMISIGLVLAFSIISFLGRSVAWFSKNEKINANGVNLVAQGLPDTEQYLMIDGVRVEENATDLFSGLVPGKSVTFQLYVKNKTEKNIEFGLLLAPPTENDDIPYVIDGLYHYFGTQLRINSIKNDESELLSLEGNERYLLTLEESLYIGADKSLPPTSVNSEYDFSVCTHKTLTDIVTIGANGELILDIEIEFADNGILQNPYIDYGNTESEDSAKAALRLSRTLLCYYSYVD